MRAFSYACTLSVTWQRWRRHHSIHCIRKPHAALKLHGCMFYRTGVSDERRLWFSTCFTPTTLTLTRWPSYTNLTRIVWRYTGCANINFLREGFRKLSRDRQTHTHRTGFNGHFLGWPELAACPPKKIPKIFGDSCSSILRTDALLWRRWRQLPTGKTTNETRMKMRDWWEEESNWRQCARSSLWSTQSGVPSHHVLNGLQRPSLSHVYSVVELQSADAATQTTATNNTSWN